MPIIIHYPIPADLYKIDTPLEVHIFLDHWDAPPPPKQSDAVRYIYIQCESSGVVDCHHYLRQYGHLYDIVAVFDPVRLGLPNARVGIAGTGGSWIPPALYTQLDLTKKRFAISSVTGSKLMAPGHHLRHRAYYAQKHYERFPITFFRSGHSGPMPVVGNNPMLESLGCVPASGSTKMPLFETFQFSLVIENNKETNYFTEKIIDCVVTKTIPIYWGCPNIGDYFDTTGWILLGDNIEDSLYDGLAKLDDGYYQRYIDVVNANYERAVKIADPPTLFIEKATPYIRELERAASGNA